MSHLICPIHGEYSLHEEDHVHCMLGAEQKENERLRTRAETAERRAEQAETGVLLAAERLGRSANYCLNMDCYDAPASKPCDRCLAAKVRALATPEEPSG